LFVWFWLFCPKGSGNSWFSFSFASRNFLIPPHVLFSLCVCRFPVVSLAVVFLFYSNVV
jgi:hypothetical protein